MLNLEDPGPHNCEVCGKQSSNRKALGRHVRKYHTDPEGRLIENSDSTGGSITTTDQSEERPFVCEFCSKTFLTEIGLDKHRVSHMSKEEREEEDERPQVGKVAAETLQGLKELYEAKYGKLGKEEIPTGAGNEVQPKTEDKEDIESMVKEELPDSDDCGDPQDMMMSESDDSDCDDSDGDLDGESPVKGEGDGKLQNLKTEAEGFDIGEIPFDMVKEEAPEYSDMLMPPLVSLPKKKRVRTKSNPAKPSVCIVCGKVFGCSSNMIKHVRKVHDKIKESYSCTQCPKVYSSRSALYTHNQADHEGVRHYCDQCERWFSRKHHLLDHMESEHEKKTFSCDICEKLFSRRGLTDHKKAVHSAVTYKCTECEQTFSTLGNLTNHRKNKHENIRYHCELCVSSFTRSSDLNIHVKTKHEGLGSMFQCDLCEKSFASFKASRLHRKAKHDQPAPTWPAVSKPLQNHIPDSESVDPAPAQTPTPTPSSAPEVAPLSKLQ